MSLRSAYETLYAAANITTENAEDWLRLSDSINEIDQDETDLRVNIAPGNSAPTVAETAAARLWAMLDDWGPK